MNCPRRRFLSGVTAVTASHALPAWCSGIGIRGPSDRVPPARTGPSRLKLSLAAYSFNSRMVRRGKPEDIAAAEMSLEKFIDFCARHGLGATELTGYYFPHEITTGYLLSLRERTHRLGLTISATAIGNDFCVVPGPVRDNQLAECREWIDHAATLGAPVIRIFAGNVPEGDTEEAAISRCAEGINHCLAYAARRGVFLALENHGGITSTPDQMFRIMELVQPSPWFGINFDSGNFQTEDPYADLERIAPWAVNAQLKVSISPGGRKEPADLPRVVRILRDSGYRGFVALEYEESESPYETIPRLLDELRPLMDG